MEACIDCFHDRVEADREQERQNKKALFMEFLEEFGRSNNEEGVPKIRTMFEEEMEACYDRFDERIGTEMCQRLGSIGMDINDERIPDQGELMVSFFEELGLFKMEDDLPMFDVMFNEEMEACIDGFFERVEAEVLCDQIEVEMRRRVELMDLDYDDDDDDEGVDVSDYGQDDDDDYDNFKDDGRWDEWHAELDREMDRRRHAYDEWVAELEEWLDRLISRVDPEYYQRMIQAELEEYLLFSRLRNVTFHHPNSEQPVVVVPRECRRPIGKSRCPRCDQQHGKGRGGDSPKERRGKRRRE
ncbi:MAG: hypothetical protein M1831_003322 [Alyxoria varia]|nr:MAG: hypothetical protein M1831_003322 [Alyxoria varia]